MTVSFFFVCDWYGARIQYPDGHWSSWQDGQSGGWVLSQAGTYHLQGAVHVLYDWDNGSDYHMYSNILTFYVADNVAPTQPSGLQSSASANNHPLLTWSPNNQSDISGYKIYKKEIIEQGWQYLSSTSGTSYEDVSESFRSYCPCHNVYYRITAYDINSNESSPSGEINVSVYGAPLDKNSSALVSKITEYSLAQNFPNPFNPETKISFQLPDAARVQLKIYDIMGSEIIEIIDENKESGYYEETFDGKNLSSGVYIYVLTATNNEKLLFSKAKQMTLIK